MKIHRIKEILCTFDSHLDLSISVLHFYVDLRAIGVWQSVCMQGSGLHLSMCVDKSGQYMWTCSPLTYVYILPTCPGKIEELMYRGNNVFHGIIKLLLWFRGMLMTDSTKFCHCFICTSKLLSKRKEKSRSYFERYSLLKLRTVLVVWHTHL